jgi:hypothetical protein
MHFNYSSLNVNSVNNKTTHIGEITSLHPPRNPKFSPLGLDGYLVFVILGSSLTAVVQVLAFGILAIYTPITSLEFSNHLTAKTKSRNRLIHRSMKSVGWARAGL